MQPSSFGRLLYRRIKQIGKTPAEFARDAGVSTGFVSNVYMGRKLPPTARIQQWVKILGIKHGTAEYAIFMLSAHCEHCPKYIRTILRKMLADLRRRYYG